VFHHYTECSITIKCVPSLYNVFHHCTECSITVQSVPSPYSVFHHYTVCSITVQSVPSLHRVFHHYKECSITIQCVPSLYSVFHHYTVCSITVQSVPSLYSVFHHYTECPINGVPNVRSFTHWYFEWKISCHHGTSLSYIKTDYAHCSCLVIIGWLHIYVTQRIQSSTFLKAARSRLFYHRKNIVSFTCGTACTQVHRDLKHLLLPVLLINVPFILVFLPLAY
jgi:hypothetical protein